MGGARLNPAQLGNPDNRPDIRDALTSVTFPNGVKAPIGNLMDEFDFSQPRLSPLVLSTYIPTGITTQCSRDKSEHCTDPTVTISSSPVTGLNVPGPFIYHVERDGMELPQCVGTAASCTDAPEAARTFIGLTASMRITWRARSPLPQRPTSRKCKQNTRYGCRSRVWDEPER